MIEYAISDMHFNHTNIIIYCNRPYSTYQEMNKDLMRRYNSEVSKQDLVYNLGDVGWNNGDKLKYLVQNLNGEKELIRGNHESGSETKYLEMGFSKIHNPYLVKDFNGVKLLMTHKPAVDEITFKAKKLDSRSYLVLPTSIMDSIDINIHGHIHNSENQEVKDGKHFNCSVEVIDYKPISLQEICNRMGF